MTSATDNRTTELREKLDELGIEHFDYDKGGRTQTMWESPGDMRHITYETAAYPAKTAKLIIEWFPTVEQAIAATLGSERIEELEELIRIMWLYLSDPETEFPCCIPICESLREDMRALGLKVDE